MVEHLRQALVTSFWGQVMHIQILVYVLVSFVHAGLPRLRTPKEVAISMQCQMLCLKWACCTVIEMSVECVPAQVRSQTSKMLSHYQLCLEIHKKASSFCPRWREYLCALQNSTMY